MNETTVGAFLEAVAAATPTPGGGSVSALAGALSVALSRMVARLARDKKGYEAEQGAIADIERRGIALQGRLASLVDEDARAYDGVVEAMRLPRATDAERAARVAQMQAAYKAAVGPPLETVRRGAEALELAELAAAKGNRSASTDAGVAILLAEAAIRGASLNCRVNLASIQDAAFRDRTEADLAELLARADAVGHRAMALVEDRL